MPHNRNYGVCFVCSYDCHVLTPVMTVSGPVFPVQTFKSDAHLDTIPNNAAKLDRRRNMSLVAITKLHIRVYASHQQRLIRPKNQGWATVYTAQNWHSPRINHSPPDIWASILIPDRYHLSCGTPPRLDRTLVRQPGSPTSKTAQPRMPMHFWTSTITPAP